MIFARHRWLLIGLVVLTLAWTKACMRPAHGIHARPPVASDAAR